MTGRNAVTVHDLRCNCRTSPLLAKYGVDVQGKAYVHIKVYKQHQMISEVIINEGVVHLHCPKCHRWNRVRFVRQLAKLEQALRPV